MRSIIERCSGIKTERNTSGVVMKLVEEVGEIATEVNIKYHGAYKKAGVDGIKGECIDALICIFDILNLEGVCIEEVESMIDLKVNKWKEKILEEA